MALTKIQGQNIANSAISTNKVDSNFTATYATYAAVAANLTPRITTVNVANSSYTVLDDVAVNTSGGYLVITGANFQSGAIVTIESSQATSTTYVNDTTLRAQVAAKNAGSYTVYVQNPDGGTAIRVNGVTFSNTPVWGTAATLSNQAANTAFAVSISANSDSNVTYSNTTSLPAGTSLLSNGLFYGTVTVGAETVYSFDVRATDAENQDTPRTFSLTVTVGPPPGYLFVWGSGGDGQLGLNNTTAISSPVQVGSSSSWSEISFGNIALGIKSDGTLWSWGAKSGAQGQNDVVYRSSPTQVGTNTNWSKVSKAGDYSVLSLKTDGTLWTFGDNVDGQLGLNDQIFRSSPTQIGSSTNWNKISQSHGQSAAIKTDGTLWMWGDNTYGQLITGDKNKRSSPVQIGSSTNWSVISLTVQGIVAIKTDGTLWGWGRNNYGNLGLNDISFRSSPTQIGSSTDWAKIKASRLALRAIKTDGTLWTAGYNNNGQLGHNDRTNRSSPVQVGTETTWNLIEGEYWHSAGIKTDGTLWTWGQNQNGLLGLNSSTTLHRSSPTQVGAGTTWITVSGHGTYAMAAIKT